MDYEQLLEWVEKQGKTEADMIYWFADSQYESTVEMSREEFVLFIMGGAPKYGAEFMRGHWDALDEETKDNYMTYMKESWEEE